MIKIGITGSVASGKTTASKILSYKKGPLFNADQQVKKIYANKKFQKLYRIFYLNKHVGNIPISFLNNTEVTIGIIIGEKKVYNLGIGTQTLKKLINLLEKKK